MHRLKYFYKDLSEAITPAKRTQKRTQIPRKSLANRLQSTRKAPANARKSHANHPQIVCKTPAKHPQNARRRACVVLERSVLDLQGFPRLVLAYGAVFESITLPTVLWDFDLTSFRTSGPAALL